MKFSVNQAVVRKTARQNYLRVEGFLSSDHSRIAVRESDGSCVWESAENLRCLPDDHDWVSGALIDTCSTCGEERA